MRAARVDRHSLEDEGVIKCVAETRAGGAQALKDAIAAGEVWGFYF